MNRIRATIVFSVMMAIGSAGILFTSCSSKPVNGIIIFTRTTGNSINYQSADSLNYIQAQIVAINPEKSGDQPTILTSGYYSARSPQISYDGKYMLFAGRQKKNDPWQIWEMDIKNLKARQITGSKEDCTDPAYLPGNKIVFSKFAAGDSLKAGFSLFTCSLDGSSLNRITFNPHTYVSTNVLNDGRVLTIGKQIFPSAGQSVFMVMRPDGTKAELFYKTGGEENVAGIARETADGKLVFVESGKNAAKGNLVSISYNRPLHSRVDLTLGIEGDFHNVYPQKSGLFLVSYRKSDSDRYSLCEFDPAARTVGKVIYADKDYDVLEAVVTGVHNRPKKLPSEVDMGVKTGLLLCQDINIIDQSAIASSLKRSSRIEIIGLDSTLGAVDVQEDGSFYLKIIADKPFRIQTVDERGNVLNSPSGWIWLRPNERRGCVGCHEDREMVPVNRVPLAVKTSPVNIPMHINKVIEKKVSLE